MSDKYFPKVKAAREKLAARAQELIDLQFKIIKDAMKAEKFEVAASANQWMIEHLPSEDGVTILDQGIDKPKVVEAKTGPSINIGFALGGMPQKALPAVVEVDIPESIDE